MTPIGDASVLLPVCVRQHSVDRNGNEPEDRACFNACPEYKRESTITFGPESAADLESSARSRPATASPVTAWLRFALALASPLRTDTAPAGDRFRAGSIEPRRDAKFLAPKGVVVEGHLLRAETYYHPAQAVVVFRRETAAVNGGQVPLAASCDWQS